MKKKVIAALLMVSMIASLLIGCGSSGDQDTNTQNGGDSTNESGGIARKEQIQVTLMKQVIQS